MDIKEALKKGRKRCEGCNMRGICVIKSADLEHICPCLECVVLVMCNKGCNEFDKISKLANAILNQKLGESIKK